MGGRRSLEFLVRITHCMGHRIGVHRLLSMERCLNSFHCSWLQTQPALCSRAVAKWHALPHAERRKDMCDLPKPDDYVR